MAHSLGQSIFQDLLEYSDEHAHKKELETTFALQARASEFFKNNPGPTLYNSQKYSGMVGLDDKPNPLGGPINPHRAGTGNLPGVGLCSDELHFWGKDLKPSHEEEKQDIIIEKFTNEPMVEYFGDSSNTGNSSEIPWVWIILISIIVLVILFVYVNRKLFLNCTLNCTP